MTTTTDMMQELMVFKTISAFQHDIVDIIAGFAEEGMNTNHEKVFDILYELVGDECFQDEEMAKRVVYVLSDVETEHRINIEDIDEDLRVVQSRPGIVYRPTAYESEEDIPTLISALMRRKRADGFDCSEFLQLFAYHNWQHELIIKLNEEEIYYPSDEEEEEEDPQ